jgi:4-hydroxy-tetrahydrodipicolinate synthase
MTIKLDWLRGCATALVTPFRSDGSIDDDCFRSLVERQITSGVKLLVPCGTTGESATMTEEEDRHVIRMTVEVARKYGARVIAGTGSNDTAAAIEYTRAAHELGADAALLVAPYYNKPTQEGMFAHFSAIATEVKKFPIILYNVPGRTSSDILPETCLKLAYWFNYIVGIKEASGSVSLAKEIIAKRPDEFRVFSGDDGMALQLIDVGADGLISVCSNEIPKETSDMVEFALAREWIAARDIYYRMLPLMEANFIETSPAPCKFLMKEMGLIEENLRLPLVPVTEATRKELQDLLKLVQTYLSEDKVLASSSGLI